MFILCVGYILARNIQKHVLPKPQFLTDFTKSNGVDLNFASQQQCSHTIACIKQTTFVQFYHGHSIWAILKLMNNIKDHVRYYSYKTFICNHLRRGWGRETAAASG